MEERKTLISLIHPAWRTRCTLVVVILHVVSAKMRDIRKNCSPIHYNYNIGYHATITE